MATLGGNPVLKALDKAKTQTYHFKAIVIAGMGFFTDAYDLFVIGLLQKLLGRLYYYHEPKLPIKAGSHATPGTLPQNVVFAVTGTALFGTLAGQLFFGWAGDRLGRKKVYGFTLLLMVVSSLGQGLSIGFSPTSVIATLCFFRFWLGFGVGGDYPLSATIMSEYSNTKTRGAFVAAVFAMQGFGYLTAAVVTIIISSIFRSYYNRKPYKAYPIGSHDLSCPQEADWVWRLILMSGAIPALLTFYSRSQMPETARYTALIDRNQQQAAADMGRVLHTEFDVVEDTRAKNKSLGFGLFSREFARRHALQLVGTCLSWFLIDIAFYSQGLFQSNVFSAVGWLPPPYEMSALTETYKLAIAQALISLSGTIPGYWFTVASIDRIGRKPIQMMGFVMMSVFLFVLAIDWSSLPKHHLTFFAMYALVFFFANFGPNATTFIVPAELFPARLRSTCHGISSAAGKAGAILGVFGFYYANTHIGTARTFYFLAGSSLLGFFVTLFCIPETKGRSLEDLSGEDADNYGAADGKTGMIDGNFAKA